MLGFADGEPVEQEKLTAAATCRRKQDVPSLIILILRRMAHHSLFNYMCVFRHLAGVAPDAIAPEVILEHLLIIHNCYPNFTEVSLAWDDVEEHLKRIAIGDDCSEEMTETIFQVYFLQIRPAIDGLKAAAERYRVFKLQCKSKHS